MNEKIRQFALSSQLISVNDLNGDLVSSYQEDVDLSEELEAFANMIVKECAEIARVYSEEGVEYNGGDAIKDHFGVEE